MLWDDAIVVDVELANTGTRTGEEVVQLYVRDPQASVTRPTLELKSFLRVELDAGGSTTITFRVPVSQLGFHDRRLKYVVEPGVFDVFVGRSAADLIAAGSVTVAATSSAPPKAFHGSVSMRL